MRSPLFTSLQPARMAAADDTKSGCNRFKRKKRRQRCRRRRNTNTRTN